MTTMSGKLLQCSARGTLRAPLITLLRRHAHVAPTGQQTFTKTGSKENSITLPLTAFAGAFALTVGVLYLSTASTGVSYELSPIRYGKFEVVEAKKAHSPSRSDVGDNEHVYLKIRAPLGKEALMLNAHHSRAADVRILSVYMKEPSLQIERPYTPLYSEAIDGRPYNAPVELLIKKYPDGELGKYAHRLGDLSEVELRGPAVTWQGPRADHFVMIVGGTGITPAYQLLNTLISQCSYLGTPLPTFSLLYAASKPSSLLLVPELAALQQEFPQQIKVRLHVDELDKSTKQSMSWTDWLFSKPPSREGLDMHEGRISQDAVRQALEQGKDSGSRRILVCGPDGMVSYIAGPRQGKLQGQLGGLLASLRCKEDEVWKL